MLRYKMYKIRARSSPGTLLMAYVLEVMSELLGETKLQSRECCQIRRYGMLQV